MLRLGIVIDSAAEVPPAVIENPLVRLLPVAIRIGDKTYIDERKPAATRDFRMSRISGVNFGSGPSSNVRQSSLAIGSPECSIT